MAKVQIKSEKLTPLILIAEDNLSNYKLFEAILAKDYFLFHASGQALISKKVADQPLKVQVKNTSMNLPKAG